MVTQSSLGGWRAEWALLTCSFISPLQDEEISCFRDIKPGAPHHYLVIPTKHVGNCKSLSKEHVPLGEVYVTDTRGCMLLSSIYTQTISLTMTIKYRWRIKSNTHFHFLMFNGKLCLKRNVFLLSYPVKRMVETGKEILQKNNISDLSDVRWASFSGAFYSSQLFTLIMWLL